VVIFVVFHNFDAIGLAGVWGGFGGQH